MTRPGPKKTAPPPPRKAVPIEDFGATHWGLLFVLEQASVAGGSKPEDGPWHTDPANLALLADLEAQGFTARGVPATLTDRGWEVSGAIRRWKAEGKKLEDFVAIVCGGCSRIRYGERRPCVCGGSK